MQLETPRLILREYLTTDFADVHEYGSDPEVSKYDVWGPNSEEDTRKYIQAMIEQSTAKERFKFDLGIFHKASGRLVGGAGIRRAAQLSRVADLGYAVNPKFQRQGLATEATRALIDFGFDALGLLLIHATCDRENPASAAVMEKCGMKRVGLQLRAKEFKGAWHDSYRYEITSLASARGWGESRGETND